MQLHEGRGELDIVTQAETVEPYRRTREDLSRLARASSLLEAIEQLAQDREPAPRLFDMLAGGLRVIDERNPAMVSAAFYLKLLAVEGLAPGARPVRRVRRGGRPVVLGARGRRCALRRAAVAGGSCPTPRWRSAGRC